MNNFIVKYNIKNRIKNFIYNFLKLISSKNYFKSQKKFLIHKN